MLTAEKRKNANGSATQPRTTHLPKQYYKTLSKVAENEEDHNKFPGANIQEQCPRVDGSSSR